MADDATFESDRYLAACTMGGLLLTAVEPVSGLTILGTCGLGLLRVNARDRQAAVLKSDLHAARQRNELLAAEAARLAPFEQQAISRQRMRALFAGALCSAIALAGSALWIWLYQRKKLREEQAALQVELENFLTYWRQARSGTSRLGNIEVPANLICVITGEPFQDPVICADGHTYERAAIEDWLTRGHRTSPLTNKHLAHVKLIPNHAVRGAVEDLST
eukprot:TRINITY_DN33730_c0_g1_i1.p1 TRINITY_DN33730_c0_g1~~TRINITY_DN33730_c0_g1_i1.p1  ORF type:complete len:238 (-),score=32.49 TRINITY_DN33730_c0_g1_i1:52-711(-)